MDLKVRRIKVRQTQQTIATLVRKSRSWVAKTEAVRGEVPADADALYDFVLRTFEHVSDAA